MRALTLAIAVASTIGAFAIGDTTPASATPLGATSGLAATAGEEGLVTQVHGWHCGRAWSSRLGWHRHPGACGRVYSAPRVYAPGIYVGPRWGYYHRPYVHRGYVHRGWRRW